MPSSPIQSSPSSAPHEVDLTSCDREPIHIPGSIQPHGAVITCNLPDWTVGQVSANVADYLSVAIVELSGSDFTALFAPATIHAIRNALQESTITGHATRLIAVEDAHGRAFDLAVHGLGSAMVCEIEPTGEDEQAAQSNIGIVHGMLRQLGSAGRNDDIFFRLASSHIHKLTGYDRVMVYRFHNDGSGEVIAETKVAGLQPYLHLRYPASDIPQQARELYRRQWLRLIPDIEYRPVPLVPPTDVAGNPLDLSLCGLRSVSPIHIEYLRNMGVSATLTISLLVEGRLWGLIACHNYSPKSISARTRTAAELYGQLLSLQIEARERQEFHVYMEEARAKHAGLLASIAADRPLPEAVGADASALLSIIPAQGLAVFAEGEIATAGVVPPLPAIDALRQVLNASPGGVFASNEIGRTVPALAEHTDIASGVLAIPISRMPRDYILFFRCELVRTVNWGGDPNKPANLGPHGDRLTPRGSFDLWTQTVRGKSADWTEAELRAAEMIRISLLEVVMRRQEAVNRERTDHARRQDVLVAELNHRVKNVLALITALLRTDTGRRQGGNATLEAVEARIEALARAHDQVMSASRGGVALSDLVHSELAPWRGEAKQSITADGPSVALVPRASQTMALVLHELATNAAKHGALSQPDGRLEITWKREPDGALALQWREFAAVPEGVGGHSGFGRTVIERTVPFDLGGTAELGFETDGLRAHFVLPTDLVAAPPSDAVTAPERHPPDRDGAEEQATVAAEAAGEAVQAGAVLFVEDELMIALDGERMLLDAGFGPVTIVPSVADARAALERDGASFAAAVLDINLRDETSAQIAGLLAELSVPFVYASGLSAGGAGAMGHDGVEIVAKPYRKDDLIGALDRAIRRARGRRP